MPSMKWTPREYADYSAKRNQLVIPSDNSKPSKYHAVITEADGIKFQSKKEAKYYRELKARIHSGEVKYFLRQVPFDLFGVKYRVDFMEVLNDGTIRYVDVKGFRTPAYKNKRRQVETIYPVTIIEV